MKSASIARAIAPGLLILQVMLSAVPAARADEDTIKIGILHSLSGTMAISETSLRDTLLAVCGQLNPTVHGPSVSPELPADFNKREAWTVSAAGTSRWSRSF